MEDATGGKRSLPVVIVAAQEDFLGGYLVEIARLAPVKTLEEAKAAVLGAGHSIVDIRDGGICTTTDCWDEGPGRKHGTLAHVVMVWPR
ncbi:hypothetical protein dsx2_0727 [Desulfovibrio sp. X2]|uniref:hypothetical protein n=1 Tax=Desulfovibrio sp. X2 TaxID=941449 RepID=UPI000358DA5D|nr:hypothetical protein [Desulfovibrio sp. X2]EPR37381.1 hypothetical protein dsx2_0727 [Desulfovibrio sp. X2]